MIPAQLDFSKLERAVELIKNWHDLKQANPLLRLLTGRIKKRLPDQIIEAIALIEQFALESKSLQAPKEK